MNIGPIPIPDDVTNKIENGDLIVRTIAVDDEKFDRLVLRSTDEGWTLIGTHSEGGRSWAALVTPVTTQNGEG